MTNRSAIRPPRLLSLDNRLLRKKEKVRLWYQERVAMREKARSEELLAKWDETLVESHEACDNLIPIYEALFADAGIPHADLRYVVGRIYNEGWGFVSGELPRLEKALLRGLSTGTFESPSSFFCLPHCKTPRFLRGLWTQIFHDNGQLRADASPIAVQMVRQILGLAYKASVPCGPDKEMASIQQFVMTEKQLSVSVQTIDWGDPILRLANLLTIDIFSDYNRDKLAYKNGPGVTANVPIEEKFEAQLNPIPVVSEWGSDFFFNGEDALSRLSRYPVWSHRALIDSKATAVVKLVPKDARGPRIISAEPFENQWVQQGIRGYMYEKLQSHSLTSGSINFTRQSVNRTLAREASVTRKFSTLDLKEASDRVTIPLVRAIFRGTNLLHDLEWSRSSHTRLPDGSVLPLVKFAPMGSALCFPVLAYSIFAIGFAGLVGLGINPSEVRRLIYVYGDDVIVSTEYANYVIDLLERYLLLVNKDKSFINSRFCESCGMDSFDGNDVSIIRLKTWPSKNKLQDPEVLVSLVETANQLFELGYAKTAEYLYREVEEEIGRLPYGYSHSSFLNRRFLRFLGNSAFEATARRMRLKFRYIPYLNRKSFCFKAPVVRPCGSLVSKHVSFGGHMLRIEPLLGTGEMPDQGVFPKRRSIAILSKSIIEEEFSPYAASTWVPGVKPSVPCTQS